MSISSQRNIAELLAGADEGALDPATITAGAGNDAVAVAGNIIDRQKSGRGYALSAALFLQYKAVLAATKTLTVTVLVKGSSDSGMASPTTLVSYPATVVSTGGTGGSTNHGILKIAVDLSSADRYLQATVTQDLSATATDTVLTTGLLVFGGQDELPAV